MVRVAIRYSMPLVFACSVVIGALASVHVLDRGGAIRFSDAFYLMKAPAGVSAVR